MLDRVRRMLGADQRDPVSAAMDRAINEQVAVSDDAPPAEGAYAGPGRTHYVLDGQSLTLCGRPLTGLHRWSSSWPHVEATDRCRRCNTLVGARGEARHGRPTMVDIVVFGVEPPDLSEGQRAAFREAWERGATRRDGDPPPPAGATFSDPPFLYARDPFRRHGSLEPLTDRVINDVYTRIENGKKWHRVYETSLASEHPALAPFGRSFLLPCGNAGSDRYKDANGAFYDAPFRTDPPGPDEICKACAQSDAKYGKLGDLPRDRWDR